MRLARGQQPRDRAPPSFSAASAGVASVAGADHQQPPAAVVVDEMLGDARRVAVEPLALRAPPRPRPAPSPSDVERRRGPCRRPAGPAHNRRRGGCRRNGSALRLFLEMARRCARAFRTRAPRWQRRDGRSADCRALPRCDRPSTQGQVERAGQRCVGRFVWWTALPAAAWRCRRPRAAQDRRRRRRLRTPAPAPRRRSSSSAPTRSPTTATPTSSPRRARCGCRATAITSPPTRSSGTARPARSAPRAMSSSITPRATSWSATASC